MSSISRREALRRLATEIMGWELYQPDENGMHSGNFPCFDGQVLLRRDIRGRAWDPFTDLNDAFELQARLNPNQLWEAALHVGGVGTLDGIETDAVACLTTTAEQRTRAICKVILKVEVE